MYVLQMRTISVATTPRYSRSLPRPACLAKVVRIYLPHFVHIVWLCWNLRVVCCTLEKLQRLQQQLKPSTHTHTHRDLNPLPTFLPSCLSPSGCLSNALHFNELPTKNLILCCKLMAIYAS